MSHSYERTLLRNALHPKRYGPAMQALGEGAKGARRRRFVEKLFTAPNDTQAAREAGFADNGKSGIRVTAFRLCRDPRIQAAVREEAAARNVELLGESSNALREILVDPKHPQRLKAALAVFNRTGLHEISESRSVNVTIDLSPREKVAMVMQLAREAGLDPRSLLGRLDPEELDGVVIEHDGDPAA